MATAKSSTANKWGDDFVDAQTATNRSVIWASQGPAGSGKTHFALTAPDPIAYFLFDPGGLKGLMDNPLFKLKEVKLIDFSKMMDWGRLEKDARMRRALDVINKFDRSWDIALRNARSIVIDKDSELWETIRYAHDEVFSPTPKNFYELNLDYRALFIQAESAGANLALIRGLKEKWGVTGYNREGKKQMGFTGEQIARGHKEAEELVQVNFAHRWDDVAREWKVKILEKCRLGSAIDLMGTEYPNLDYDMLVNDLLFPDAA